MLAQSGCIAPELAHRRTQQKTGLGPLRRTVLKAKRLPIKTRAKYADALCTSRLFYNAHVWGELSRDQQQAMVAAHFAPFRTILGIRVEEGGRRKEEGGGRGRLDAGRCLFKTKTQHHRMVGNNEPGEGPNHMQLWVSHSGGRNAVLGGRMRTAPLGPS
eukprot:1540626-Pyramimonas_sp.AAC.1